MKVAPILVLVIVVALVGVALFLGALSLGSGNRGENAPTPALIAKRFYPAGTARRILQDLSTMTRTLPRPDTEIGLGRPTDTPRGRSTPSPRGATS